LHNQSGFDRGWKRRALQGDVEALDRFVDASLQALFRFCLYRLGGNRHLCEDVVQETLVRAISDLTSYEPQRRGNNIFPWLTGLARNEIRRALAREPAATSLESLWARMDVDLRDILSRLDSSRLDDAALERDETRELVNVTMSQIPPHYRQALEAKYVSQQSVRQMALERATSEKGV
jgi:RNA polymerase sigma factor (sigma-70 family)